jgi:uncharacterized coiled-coil DUF342 family protein
MLNAKDSRHFITCIATTLLLTLLSPLDPAASSSAQDRFVSITVTPPPPNQLTIPDLWQVTLVSAGDEQLALFLRGTVTEAADGVVLTGTTSPFEVPPGGIPVMVTARDLEPIDIDAANSRYERIVLRTGGAPAGNYLYCVEAVHFESGEVLGDDCIDVMVDPSTPPELITPADGDELETPYPVFAWTEAMPPGTSYGLRVHPVMDDQRPSEAIAVNPAWFELFGLESSTLAYPVDAHPLEPGIYVAQVISLSGDRVLARSEPVIFELLSTDPDDPAGIAGRRAAADDTDLTRPARQLIHCHLENNTFLLPGDACTALGGRPWDGTYMATGYRIDRFSDEEADRILDSPAVFRDIGFTAEISDTPSGEAVLSLHGGAPAKTLLSGTFQLRNLSPTEDEPGSGHSTLLPFAHLRFDSWTEQTLAVAPETGAHIEISLDALGFGETPITQVHYLDFPREEPQPEFDDAFQQADYREFTETYLHPWDEEIAQTLASADALATERFHAHQNIRELADRIRGLQDEVRRRLWDLEFLEEQNRIIDDIEQTFRSWVARILRDIENLPEADVPSDEELEELKDHVDQCRADLEACEERASELADRIAELTQKADDMKDDIMDKLDELDQIHKDNGYIGGTGFVETDSEGGYGPAVGPLAGWTGYPPGIDNNSPLGQHVRNLINEVFGSLPSGRDGMGEAWRQKMLTIQQLKAELEKAEEECDELRDRLDEAEGQLEDAREAQAEQQTYDAAGQQLQDALNAIARHIRAMLRELEEYCEDDCDFSDALRELLASLPPHDGDWDRVWEQLERVRLQKQALENRLRREIRSRVREIERRERQIAEAEEQARRAADRERRSRELAEQERREREARRAEQERRAREREQERERTRREIEDIINDAEDNEAASEALARMFGLRLLSAFGDEETRAAGRRIARMIGGAITLANMPECTCEILDAFISLMNPNNSEAEIRALAAAFLDVWRRCASLPAIGSVPPGASELVDIVMELPRSVKIEMIQSLRTVREIRCR